MNEEALKSRLKNIATQKNMTFNQIWKQFLLERFLARLSVSNHQEKLIFKGGFFLANYLNIGRGTRGNHVTLLPNRKYFFRKIRNACF